MNQVDEIKMFREGARIEQSTYRNIANRWYNKNILPLLENYPFLQGDPEVRQTLYDRFHGDMKRIPEKHTGHDFIEYFYGNIESNHYFMVCSRCGDTTTPYTGRADENQPVDTSTPCPADHPTEESINRQKEKDASFD